MSNKQLVSKNHNKCYVNYFKLGFEGKVQMYGIDVEPNPPNRLFVIRQLLRQHKEDIKESFGQQYIFLNFKLFSLRTSPNKNYEGTVDNIPYNMTIDNEGPLDNTTPELKEMLIGRIFNILQGKMKFKVFGRSYFDPTKAVDKEGLSIWPGFKTCMKPLGNQFFINIDAASKVLRRDTVLDSIKQIRDKAKNNYESRAKSELIGQSIITNYNRLIYRIDELDFSRTPMDTFRLEDGTETTFLDYYRKKHNIEIQDPEQPMIINKPKKGRLKELCLIPELCLMTGLTEKQRARRDLMTSLSSLIKPNCSDRMNKCKQLTNMIMDNPTADNFIKEWDIRLSNEPLSIDSLKISSGNMLMGDNRKISFENSSNIDRESQCKMFQTPNISKIIVFAPKNQKRETEGFLKHLKSSTDEFQVNIDSLDVVEIERDMDDREWIQKSKSHLKPGITLAIYIITGPKINSRTYKSLKSFLYTEAPVPSQMINAKTLANPKNQRSIINKILIQINAKLGGIPWAIDSLPFSDQPTMVMGINTLMKGKTSKSIAAVGTVNRFYCQYWSELKNVLLENEAEVLEEVVCNGILAFQKANNMLPKRLIIYREGLGGRKNNPMAIREVESFKNAIMKAVKASGVHENDSEKLLQQVGLLANFRSIWLI